MSFRFSAGDISECAKLLVKIGTVLKDSRDSTAEYQSAVNFLKGVETTVQGVGNILQNHRGLLLQTAFEEHAAALLTAVTRFKEKTEGYDSSLGVNGTDSEAKKTWKKFRLALFGHIEELKLAVSYPQSVVNDLIGLQGLDILLKLFEKPTLSPQQFQDSTDEILRNFPILDTAIDTLRSDIAVRFTTMQQTTESVMQRNFDQVQQNLSDGNILQRSFIAQAQADTDAQDLWRSQFQISISEIHDKAQQHVEALQEVKQVQETNHLHSMQAAFQAFSWGNAFRPAASRPVITVIRKTVITNSRVSRNAPATKDVSPQGSSSQGGNSEGGKPRGGNSKGGSSRGAGSQGGVSRGESSRGGSKRGGGEPRRANARGGECSRGSSSGASRSRRGLPIGGSNPRGGGSRGGNSKGGGSHGGNSNRGSSSQGGDSRAGSANKAGTSMRGNSGGGRPSRGGHAQRGNSRSSDSRGGSANKSTSTQGHSGGGGSSRGDHAQGGNSRGSDSRGGSAVRGNSTRGNSNRGGSSRGGISRGNNNIRRGSVRGKRV